MLYKVYYLVMTMLVVQSQSALRRGIFTMSSSWLRKPHFDPTSPLQSIYTNLATTGLISPAEPEKSEALYSCLQSMSCVSLQDLGIKGFKFSKQVCMTIAQHENFHIAAFLLPKGRCLPIHDHPNMAVCSKLIAGELKVRSFTPTNNAWSANSNIFEVELTEDCTKTSADAAWVISSTQGNYHEFTALSDCVILDVLVPPYAHPARTCTYYSATSKLPSRDTGSRASTGQLPAETSSVLRSSKPRFVLEKVPEEVVYRKFGLPVAVDYAGYVPSPPPV